MNPIPLPKRNRSAKNRFHMMGQSGFKATSRVAGRYENMYRNRERTGGKRPGRGTGTAKTMNTATENKRDLLGKLSIDRAGTGNPRQLWLWGGILFALGAAAALGLALIVFSPAPADDGPQQAMPAGTVTSVDANETSNATTQPSSAATPSGDRVLNASGYITARRIATISAELTGRITDVLVEEGMVVEEGQVVARLDAALATVDYELSRANVDSATATVQMLEADLAEARRVYERNRALKIDDFASEAVLTRSESQVASLEAQLNRARAELAAAEFRSTRQAELLEDYTIRAPFAGVVIDKNAQPGEIVSPISAGGGFTRTGICTIVDMDSLEIEVDVNEAFIGRVFEGQAVEAALDAYPDWRIPARVITIVPAANRDKATVRVRIGIDERDSRILPDMGVKVAFLDSRADGAPAD